MIAVIGIDRYTEWSRLDNAVSDARAAARLFTGLGFEQVTAPLLDEAATGNAMRHLVTDELAQLSPDDSLVVFFAGHGHTHTTDFGDTSVKTGCVIPVDGARPGDARLRQLRLVVPASETAPDTMLLLTFEDYHHRAPPPSVSRRVRIVAPEVAPVLGVQCQIPGRNRERPELDTGEQIVARCIVENSGNGAANAVLQAALSRQPPAVSPAQRVAPGGRTSFDLPIAIPSGLAIDSTVEISIVARDRQFARSASTRIVGVIRKPKLCAPGQLTHTQYRAKLAELRAARVAGDVTQDQFDRYDAELVSCLNDVP